MNSSPLTGCILSVVLYCSAASAQTPPAVPDPGLPSFESDRAEVRERLRVARDLFERQNFDAALVEFQRVYELLAGSPQRPRALYNIAQCQEQLGRYDAAISSYGEYLEALGESAPYRDEVLGTLRTLQGLLGTILIESNVRDAEVWVDDHRVGSAMNELRVPGGRHTVSLRSRGYVPAQQEVSVTARSSRTLRFSLERAQSSRGLTPAFFWTAVGVTSVAAGVGVVFGVQSLTMDADARASLEDPMRRFTVTEALRESIQTSALVADVLYGTAGVLAVGATVLFLMTDFRGRPAEAAQRSTVWVSPWGGQLGAGLSLGGTF